MSQLKARPVERSGEAAYPTKLEVLARPRLLERYMPSAWRARAELLGAAGLLLAANMAGCGAPAASGVSEQPECHAKAPASSVDTTSTSARPRRLTKDSPAIVAPIFEHGEGRGATGCIVTNPPVFLSEEEALQIITEELAQHGVAFKERKAPIGEIGITQLVWEFEEVDGETQMVEREGIVSKSLAVDLYDDDRKIAIEFVSREDFRKWDRSMIVSTVRRYDCKGLARNVSGGVEKSLRGLRFAAFYDPATEKRYDCSGGWREVKTRASEKSKKQLRAQVQDFVEWLKSEGVL